MKTEYTAPSSFNSISYKNKNNNNNAINYYENEQHKVHKEEQTWLTDQKTASEHYNGIHGKIIILYSLRAADVNNYKAAQKFQVRYLCYYCKA